MTHTTIIKLCYDIVPEKIRELRENGYVIGIISNQGGIASGIKTENEIKTKFETVFNILGGNCMMFVANNYDFCRKPAPGIFQFLQSRVSYPLTKDNTFFCGDACKASFDLTDLYFAHNCGIPFYTPSSVFLGSTLLPPTPYPPPSPDIDFQAIEANSTIDMNALLERNRRFPELVLLVGPPSCGKSTFCKEFLKHYWRVDLLTLKTPKKCLRVAEKYLRKRVSVVFDSSNPSRNNREPWIALARQLNIPVRALVFDRSRNLVNHLITFGSFGFGNSRRETPKYIIKRFYKDFEEPSLDEGFTAVIKIPFQKKKFASKEEEEAFHYYLSAKRKFYV